MIRKKPVANSKKVAVTFEMPAEAASTNLCLLGDFNGWDPNVTSMKRLKGGGWSATLRLDAGNYRFRYLADGAKWENDPAADAYEPSGMGSENCVVVVG
jgi:1,4-alpha-glucan branching enzyme